MRRSWLWAGVVVLLAGAGCVLRPRVELAPGASLQSYRWFEVGPVTDETGSPPRLPTDVTDSLRSRLASRLREHGYDVVAGDSAAGPVLRIDSRVVDLRSSVRSRCVLRSTLTDRDTGRRLGDIIAEEEDWLTAFPILMRCARVVADEIDRRVRGR